jgi:ferredoxin-NADP reductase
VRIGRGSVKTVVYQAIQHPSKVLEVRLKRRDGKPFRYKSGQYTFLNSPYLAAPEWHPFTITSAPNGDPYLSFHIKVGTSVIFFQIFSNILFFFRMRGIGLTDCNSC